MVEGIVESRPASGIYVADSLPGDAVKPAASAPDARPAPPRLSHMPMPPLPRACRTSSIQQPQPAARSISFPGRPSAGSVSAEDLAPPAAEQSVSRRRRAGCPNMASRPDLPALRTAIADHLAAARGIVADPSRIVIVTGVQEGHQHRGTAVSRPRRARARSRIPAIRARRLPSRPPAPRSPASPSTEGLDSGRSAAAAAVAALLDALASISDRRNAVAARRHRDRSPGRGDTAATSSRTTMIAISATRDRHLPAIAALAPDCTIYLGTFSQIARRRIAARLHGRARAARRRRLRRKGACSTTAIPGSSRRRSPR